MVGETVSVFYARFWLLAVIKHHVISFRHTLQFKIRRQLLLTPLIRSIAFPYPLFLFREVFTFQSIHQGFKCLFDLPTNHIGELGVKSGRRGVALDLEIQLNREIEWGFSCECSECRSEESRFSGLSGCKDDDVFSIFDALNKII